MLQIDDTPLILTVVDKPDAYTLGKKKIVYMQVANPRKNEVKAWSFSKFSGDGARVLLSSRVFVGNINPVNRPASRSPLGRHHPSSLTLNYDNGDNPHTVSMELPVTFGADKKAANPVDEQCACQK